MTTDTTTAATWTREALSTALRFVWPITQSITVRALRGAADVIERQ